MDFKLKVELCDNEGNWPPVKTFYVERPLAKHAADGWSVGDLRSRIQALRSAADELEAKANELGL